MHRKSLWGERVMTIVIAIIAILIVFGIIFFLARMVENSTNPVSDDNGIVTRENISEEEVEDDKVYIDGKWYRPKKDIRTTLLIGIDDFGEIRENDAYENQNQADFLLLLAKNDTNGDTFSIQINRDTITDVPVLSVNGKLAGREEEQIALAHTYGNGGAESSENVVEAVKYFLYNIPVDKYIKMSMSGIALMNDEVGGVELKSKDDIPQIGAKKDEKIFLEGDDALVYVRARQGVGDETNLSRQERQRQYILAWSNIAKDKFKTSKAATEFISHISPYLETNCDAVTLANMAQELSEYETAPIYVPEGEAVDGKKFVEFYADEDKLRELIINLFYEEIEQG